MPLFFPSKETLHESFRPAAPYSQRSSQLQQAHLPTPKQQSRPARSKVYVAYSVVDDAKKKASALSAEAQKEFDAASLAAQKKVGGIELYSAKYYAACTFGGLMACVCINDSSIPSYHFAPPSFQPSALL